MAKFVFKAKKSYKKPINESRVSYSSRRKQEKENITNFNEDDFEAKLDDIEKRNQKLSDAIAELEKQLGLPVGGQEEFDDGF